VPARTAFRKDRISVKNPCSELHHREFTEAGDRSLNRAGRSDTRLVMFASAVTGFSCRSGTSFDNGGRSDNDLAIVSHGPVVSSV
jgi:hypothetical protein